jgi:aldehyde:ferredoxin oxidoreductase
VRYFLTLKAPHDEHGSLHDKHKQSEHTRQGRCSLLLPELRLWFTLHVLCKLPLNDIEPVDNSIKYKGIEAARVPEHLNNYLTIYTAITGRPLDREGMILQSERVYNFERIFNLRMGKGTSKFHEAPDRGLGPVWEDEWMARPDYFDARLKEFGEEIEGKSVKEKIALLQKHRRSLGPAQAASTNAADGTRTATQHENR